MSKGPKSKVQGVSQHSSRTPIGCVEYIGDSKKDSLTTPHMSYSPYFLHDFMEMGSLFKDSMGNYTKLLSILFPI